MDVREAGGKSNNMERLGFERGMGMLLTSPLSVKEVVTDGHLEIAALMSKFLKYCSLSIEKTCTLGYLQPTLLHTIVTLVDRRTLWDVLYKVLNNTMLSCFQHLVTIGVNYFDIEREDKYKNVVHQNDVWHGGKNIAKKLNAVSIPLKHANKYFDQVLSSTVYM